MGVQTRSSATGSPVKPKISTNVILPNAEGEPYKLFVLPSDTSNDARFVLLKNPRDGARQRYYFCPSKGIFEVTKISAGVLDPRSILFSPDEDANPSTGGNLGGKPGTATNASENASSDTATDQKEKTFEGYINKSAEIFVGTPFDPIFILLPLLGSLMSTSRTHSGEGLFRPFDDLIDELSDDDGHLRYILNDTIFRPTLLRTMSHICDAIEAADEQMYRLSMPKLYEHILSKAKRVVDEGLPASLEDRFVTRGLEVPMLSVKREESTTSLVIEENDATPECPNTDVSESQSTVASTNASVALSEASSATSVGIFEHTPSPGSIYLQRLRTAISFITASYLDPALATRLTETSRTSKASPDFGPLDEHLQQLSKLRAEALAIRSNSDFSKKRNLDDDEAAQERTEKKRKQEEEEKRNKSQESRGVRDLKKVNVSGMKKMSAFFAKKAPTAKSKS